MGRHRLHESVRITQMRRSGSDYVLIVTAPRSRRRSPSCRVKAMLNRARRRRVPPVLLLFRSRRALFVALARSADAALARRGAALLFSRRAQLVASPDSLFAVVHARRSASLGLLPLHGFPRHARPCAYAWLTFVVEAGRKRAGTKATLTWIDVFHTSGVHHAGWLSKVIPDALP